MVTVGTRKQLTECVINRVAAEEDHNSDDSNNSQSAIISTFIFVLDVKERKQKRTHINPTANMTTTPTLFLHVNLNFITS